MRTKLCNIHYTVNPSLYLKSVQNYHLRHSDHTYKVSTVYSILKLLSMMTKKNLKIKQKFN